ncbi:MAG: hypothetical protein J0M00_06450 [Burkholderiales bacterium]|nr:hypothetical protein [Burkholderiales bacterium]
MSMGDKRAKVVNWVGALAQLRRVNAEHLGRLVVVERAAQTQPDRPGAEPIWHVYVLGVPLRLEGGNWREADVPQACLQPLCRLPEVIAEAAIVAQAERDFDAAVTELSGYLAKHPMDQDEFDASMEQAARTALGPRRWPVVPMLDA